jgi:RNase P/RNase MRP subunit p29
MVQRVAGEYTQLVYLSNKAQAEGCKVVDSMAPRIQGIRRRLSEELSRSLLVALDDAARLTQVLKTYESIEGWEEAETVIRDRFRTFCHAVSISGRSLLSRFHTRLIT